MKTKRNPDSIKLLPTVPLRKSPRKNIKNIFNNRGGGVGGIQHQLLLGPTLQRQAKKRRLRTKALLAKQGKGQPTSAAATTTAIATTTFEKGEARREGKLDDGSLCQSLLPCRKVSPVTPEMALSKMRQTKSNKEDVLLSQAMNSWPKVSSVTTEKTPTIPTTRKIETTRKTKIKPKVMKEVRTVPKKARMSRSDYGNKRINHNFHPLHQPPGLPSGQVESARAQHNSPQPNSSPYGSLFSSSLISQTPVPILVTIPSVSASSSLLEQLSIESLTMELALKRKMTVLRRREIALHGLVEARHIKTIFAYLAIVKVLQEGDEFQPAVASLVNNALVAGQLLLKQNLMNGFTSPRAFGGLAYSAIKAKIFSDHLCETIGTSLGTIPITLEALMMTGLTLTESEEILPLLLPIEEDIKMNIISLGKVFATIGSC